jgi:phosphatidylinositol-bisphosphatase
MMNTEYTCFANKLNRLTRLPGPVRALKSPDDRVPARQPANAPREIMTLINWLMTHVTDPVRAIKILTACANGTLE